MTFEEALKDHEAKVSPLTKLETAIAKCFYVYGAMDVLEKHIALQETKLSVAGVSESGTQTGQQSDQAGISEASETRAGESEGGK